MPSFRAPAVLLLLLLPALAAPAEAQRQLALEANLFHGTVSYAWPIGEATFAGLDVGVGVPQLDWTLEPSDGDFVPILHVGSFVRMLPSETTALEAGVRTGFADLTTCGASDCLPGVFVMATGAATFGWRRVQLGPRIWAGGMREDGGETRFVLAVSPVSARIYLRR